jgi:hypothetical protein
MDGLDGPGRWVVSCVFSIDEGDAWYIRLARNLRTPSSDRLHVVFADRAELGPDLDWLEGCTLVKTVDPGGLAKREEMLAAGWSYTPPPRCPTCGQRTGILYRNP